MQTLHVSEKELNSIPDFEVHLNDFLPQVVKITNKKVGPDKNGIVRGFLVSHLESDNVITLLDLKRISKLFGKKAGDGVDIPKTIKVACSNNEYIMA